MKSSACDQLLTLTVEKRLSLPMFMDEVSALKKEFEREATSNPFEGLRLRGTYVCRTCVLFQAVYGALPKDDPERREISKLFYQRIAPEIRQLEPLMAPRLYLAEYHAIEDFSDEEMEYVADALKRIALPQASHARQVVKIPIAAVGPQMDRFREQYRNLYQENSDEKRGGVA